MKFQRRGFLLATVAAGAILASNAWADTYPSKMVRIIVPYPAGSSLDVVARSYSDLFTKHFGQPSIVVNQPGGSAAIGTRAAAQSKPDGYTILLGTNQTHGANSALYPNLGYDAIGDFAPIALVGRLQHVLVVRNSLGVKTLDEFIALARQPDQKINYGSSGTGSASHLAAEMFMAATGAEMAHIPYNGSGQAAMALMGGHIDATFTTMPSVLSFIKSGDMTALAVASKDRAPQLPELKTLAEQGVQNSEADAWTGFFAPSRVPPANLDVLTQFTVEAFSTPDMKQKLDAAGFVPDMVSGAAFGQFLEGDMKRWADVIQAADVKVE